MGPRAWPHKETAQVITAGFRAAERYSLAPKDWHDLHLATLLRGSFQIMNPNFVLRHVVTSDDLKLTNDEEGGPRPVPPEKVGQVLLANSAHIPFELEYSTGEWGGDRYRPQLTPDGLPYMVFGDTGVCLTPETVLNGGIEIVTYTPSSNASNRHP